MAQSDVLTDPRSGVTSGILGDLRDSSTLTPQTYDCIILTQTLQFIDRPLAAIANLHSALRNGGTLLITVPGIAQRDNYDDNLWGDYYRWMPRGFQTLMDQSSFKDALVASRGNVLTTTAFLNNLAVEDLKPQELAYFDRDYPLIITCVARK